LSDSSAFSPDAGELRLVAQLSGVAPSKLAAGLSDPERILDHLTAAECYRVADGFRRLLVFEQAMNAALDVAISRIQKDRSN
jgi:hypothetical protein